MRWGQNDADGERGATQESEWHGARPDEMTLTRKIIDGHSTVR